MKIDRITVHVFRAPTPRPVATSFGVMRDRPAVFVQLFDGEGAFGWGEIFANWPAAGAEHRARLLIEDVADLVLGKEVASPHQMWVDLTRRTHIRALQCGEWGPFRQVLAGLDTAMHDIFARRAGRPLAGMLSHGAAGVVPVYASGLQVSVAAQSIAEARDGGIAAFKVKVGFDEHGDLAALTRLAADLRPSERLFADANQAWDLPAALRFMAAASELPLGWIEEPVPADSPADFWGHLARTRAIPLAVGENITGEAGFSEAIQSRNFAYLQPDLAKWGGVTGCFAVARQALAAGLTYCPHFLGGGIGLIASAHLLAASGGTGLLELDVNANPLRDAFLRPDTLRAGQFHLFDAPGLGIEALPDSIEPYRTLYLDTAA